jgi:hypothetical protein
MRERERRFIYLHAIVGGGHPRCRPIRSLYVHRESRLVIAFNQDVRSHVLFGTQLLESSSSVVSLESINRMGCAASTRISNAESKSVQVPVSQEKESDAAMLINTSPSAEASKSFKAVGMVVGTIMNASMKASEMKEWERNALSRDLRLAIMKGDDKTLETLLSSEKWLACINEEDQDGQTPLHHAVSMKRFDIVMKLVEKGANVDSASDVAGTPLTMAAKKGFTELADYLLKQGASKARAIDSAGSYHLQDMRGLVEGFFIELERVSLTRPELEAKREELKARLMSSKEPETLPTTCKGIKIGGLRKMRALMQSECEAGRFKEDKSFPDGTHCKGTMKYEELTTTDIVYRYVKDDIISTDRRVADAGILGSEFFTTPLLFISHAWKGRFFKLVDEIIAYAEKHKLSEDYAVWMDMWAVNQHHSNEFSKQQNQEDVRAFQDVLKTCLDGTLVVCDFDMCETYLRAWCLFEWDWTMFYHGRDRLRFVGLSEVEACRGAENIDVDQADCFKAEDKEMILREIIKNHGGTTIFNDKLKLKMVDVFYSLSGK